MTSPTSSTNSNNSSVVRSLRLLWKVVILQQCCWCLLLLLGGWQEGQDNVAHSLSEAREIDSSMNASNIHGAVVPQTETPEPVTQEKFPPSSMRVASKKKEEQEQEMKVKFPPHWNHSKPSLIIHIGPSKTGTTSLQKESLAFTEALAKDHYVYLGRYASPKLREPAQIGTLIYKDPCFQKASQEFTNNITSDFLQTPCWASRVARLEEYRRNGTSIVLSDEAYSYNIKYKEAWDEHHFQMLRAAFRDWNVLVVPTYRRYTEWILSTIKEFNGKHCLHVNSQWSGKPCENLWANVQQHLARPDFRGSHYANLDVTVPAWQAGGFDTQVLNFHAGHITCTFYCQVVPNTPHACQYCHEQSAHGQFNAQAAAQTAYNDIVYEAAQRGLISAEKQQQLPRYNVTMELAQHHHFAGFQGLPLKCPSQSMLEKLLTKSLQLEKRTFPEWAQTQETNHRHAFWAKQQQYCTVDTQTLLRDKTTWEQVLQALTPNNTQGFQYS